MEYKREALEHWKSSGRSAARIAAELGIRAPLLYRWAKEFRLAAQQGRQPELKIDVSVMQAEIRRLTEENAKLFEQREVLKKSLGILSEAPPRGVVPVRRDQVWVTDDTCVLTGEGWLYVVALLHVYTRCIVGGACTKTSTTRSRFKPCAWPSRNVVPALT